MKIGVFDSGLGGLTILRAIREVLPSYDYLYFGDTANLPYGDKSEAEIESLTHEAVRMLFDAGAVLVIVACNTASAKSLRKLQDTMLAGTYADRKLLGVIIPTIEALQESGAARALLVGTKRTVASRKYELELEKIGSPTSLIAVATPGLVPLIEVGELAGAYQMLESTIEPLLEMVDIIILGCTHYTLLKSKVRERVNPMKVVSQDEVIPEKLKTYLMQHPELEERLSRGRDVKIFLSKESPRYLELRSRFFNT